MQVVFVKFPIVLTDDGREIEIAKIKGHPRVGYELKQLDDGGYEILAATNDSECVGGVCPIK